MFTSQIVIIEFKSPIQGRWVLATSCCSITTLGVSWPLRQTFLVTSSINPVFFHLPLFDIRAWFSSVYLRSPFKLSRVLYLSIKLGQRDIFSCIFFQPISHPAIFQFTLWFSSGSGCLFLDGKRWIHPDCEPQQPHEMRWDRSLLSRVLSLFVLLMHG